MSQLAQPLTPTMELDLDDLEICGAISEMTRAVQVPKELLAEMRDELAVTMLDPWLDQEEETIVVMPEPMELARTVEAPWMAPIRKPTRTAVFFAVLIGIVFYGATAAAATALVVISRTS